MPTLPPPLVRGMVGSAPRPLVSETRTLAPDDLPEIISVTNSKPGKRRGAGLLRGDTVPGDGAPLLTPLLGCCLASGTCSHSEDRQPGPGAEQTPSGVCGGGWLWSPATLACAHNSPPSL